MEKEISHAVSEPITEKIELRQREILERQKQIDPLLPKQP